MNAGDYIQELKKKLAVSEATAARERRHRKWVLERAQTMHDLYLTCKEGCSLCEEYRGREAVNCKSCDEWFEVWTNTGSPGLCFCPVCGYEFTQEDLDAMQALEDATSHPPGESAGEKGEE